MWSILWRAATVFATVSYDRGFRLRPDFGLDGKAVVSVARANAEDDALPSEQRCYEPSLMGSQVSNRAMKVVAKYCAPSFLVIGFGRCGTTSLSKYLAKHPRITYGTRKEHFYFYRPEFCDLQHGPNSRDQCELQAYASQFPVFRAGLEKNFTFDATPMLGGDMGVPASDHTMGWLRSKLPDLKLLVLIKSPADRFLSNPLATAKVTRLQESLLSGDNAMPHKLRQLLMDNCYIDRLEAWLRYFPPNRFFLIRSEDLRGPLDVRQRILDSVHDFLGIEPHTYDPADLDHLENLHRATNSSLHPKARAVINCLPRLKACEQRLDDAIDSEDRVIPWCDDAAASLDDGAEIPVLRASRPPTPSAVLPPRVAYRLKPSASPLPSAIVSTNRFLVLGFGGWRALAAFRQLLSKHPAIQPAHPGSCHPTTTLDCPVQDYLGGRRVPPLGVALFEATAALGGSQLDTRVADWYYRHFPNLKFVVGLASPAQRFVSGRGRFGSTFDAVKRTIVERPQGLPRKVKNILTRYCYVSSLKTWLERYPADRFLLIRTASLDSSTAVGDIFDAIEPFLGLERRDRPQQLLQLEHVFNVTDKSMLADFRRTIDCHPSILSCEHLTDDLLDGPPIQWCEAYQQVAKHESVIFAPTTAPGRRDELRLLTSPQTIPEKVDSAWTDDNPKLADSISALLRQQQT